MGDRDSGHDSRHRSDLEVAQRKIFIGGLSYGTDDDKLRNYFKVYGAVQDAVVMKDPVSRRSRGFGFITFEHIDSVDNVLANEPHTIDGRKVEAKRAVPRSEVNREILAKSGSSSASVSSSATVSTIGSSQAAPGSLTIGTTTASSKDNSSNSSISHRNEHPFSSSSDDFNVGYCKIFVGGLHYDTRDADFRHYFEKYGKVSSAEVMFNRETHKSRGFGFIIFESEHSVDLVCAEPEHTIDAKVVEVKRAIPRSKIAPGTVVSSSNQPSKSVFSPSRSGSNANAVSAQSAQSTRPDLRRTQSTGSAPSTNSSGKIVETVTSGVKKVPISATATIAKGAVAPSYAAALRQGAALASNTASATSGDAESIPSIPEQQDLDSTSSISMSAVSIDDKSSIQIFSGTSSESSSRSFSFGIDSSLPSFGLALGLDTEHSNFMRKDRAQSESSIFTNGTIGSPISMNLSLDNLKLIGEKRSQQPSNITENVSETEQHTISTSILQNSPTRMSAPQPSYQTSPQQQPISREDKSRSNSIIEESVDSPTALVGMNTNSPEFIPSSYQQQYGSNGNFCQPNPAGQYMQSLGQNSQQQQQLQQKQQPYHYSQQPRPGTNDMFLQPSSGHMPMQLSMNGPPSNYASTIPNTLPWGMQQQPQQHSQGYPPRYDPNQHTNFGMHPPSGVIGGTNMGNNYSPLPLGPGPRDHRGAYPQIDEGIRPHQAINVGERWSPDPYANHGMASNAGFSMHSGTHQQHHNSQRRSTGPQPPQFPLQHPYQNQFPPNHQRHQSHPAYNPQQQHHQQNFSNRVGLDSNFPVQRPAANQVKIGNAFGGGPLSLPSLSISMAASGHSPEPSPLGINSETDDLYILHNLRLDLDSPSPDPNSAISRQTYFDSSNQALNANASPQNDSAPANTNRTQSNTGNSFTGWDNSSRS